jgi:DNA anti-recombination protein RmuC
MVEEITRRIREEALAAIERQGHENARMLDARLDDAVSTIDRNMVRMSDSLEGQLDRLVRTVGDRASEAASRAAEGAIRERLDDLAARLAAAASLIERSQMQTEETVVRAVDARIAALAKMVRSDNESLARQIVADQEASKQALRAMKELQASLPADVIETIQRRMDDLAESVAKSQEMLAQRIDRMAAKIGERYENDIQIVIDRMGDAMHALASLGRGPQSGRDGDRIELE